MKKRTFNSLLKEEKPLVWITAYDYPMARCCEAAGVDMILVGDSGGMVQLGYDNTVPVTMDEMIMMCKAVRRGAPNTFIVGDMPMGSYETWDKQAVSNAIRFIKEGGCDAVKLEGGARVKDKIKAIIDAGIECIGHLGFTPQSMSVKVVKSVDEVLYNDLIVLNDIGVKMILFEALTDEAMSLVYKKLNGSIKCLGIGSGINTDGQLLIIHDMLGFYDRFRPKFAKNYMWEAIHKEIPEITYSDGLKTNNVIDFIMKARQNTLLVYIERAIKMYAEEVRNKQFPTQEYTYV